MDVIVEHVVSVEVMSVREVVEQEVVTLVVVEQDVCVEVNVSQRVEEEVVWVMVCVAQVVS